MLLREVKIRRVYPHTLPLPEYKTEGAAGMDLHAYMVAPVEIQPMEIVKVPTGFAISIPKNFEAQIRPRSGLALNHGITVVNAPGTIDCDYRGEICVGLINLGRKSFTIRHGERIAQMVVSPVARVSFFEAINLDDTDRGDGGFGHTGL